MTDLGRAIAYLCCCCGPRPIDDGSQLKNRPKPDPREKEIDAEFMSRNYTRDKSGHFSMTPTPSVLPTQSSGYNMSSSKEGRSSTKDSKPIETPGSFLDGLPVASH
ncbi:hypothetical protein FA15DRAFT_57477 [Coprinopsis marcescibilis]|uniref:Uncharacterized protein n=1 Tax=Coprinopsis marcescibilis TaxID=230819 RepID=A0A5C3KN75_COPMA|nr:hypothetical protein FA15DRAFT_57477 [Coprinopsis marcescibilis]